MLLSTARVTLFKSIDDSGLVPVDPDVTVFVGQNVSGKTAFLEALHKALPVESDVSYDVVEDYPRKALSKYEEQHNNNSATVTSLIYVLNDEEARAINSDLDYDLLQELSFEVSHKYDGSQTVSLTVPEKPFISHLLSNASLPSEITKEASKTSTLRELISALEEADLNTESTEFLEDLKQRFGAAPQGWSMLKHYIWRRHLSPNVPKFLYFDDYKLLPGKVNLLTLHQQVQTSVNNKQALSDEDNTVLALLRLARVNIDALISPTGYEESKVRLESISNSMTDKIFQFWTQNQDLEVQFDIKADPNDRPPYNNGNNLYIRIRSQRHRVSVPFNQQSKGFIWFFSFLVWFDSIKQQLDTDCDLILLLDEPGLSLHGLAQADFLRYIDELARNH